MGFFKLLLSVLQIALLGLAAGVVFAAAGWSQLAALAFGAALGVVLLWALSLPMQAAGLNVAVMAAVFVQGAALWLLWHGWHEAQAWKLAAGAALATPFVWLFGHCWGRPALHFLMPWLKKDP